MDLPSARGALALAAALLVLAAASQEGALPAEPTAERAWSVQLHLHGPASEGLGSIDTHSREADLLGVDVLWWSEHDWRAASFRHASTYGFEGPEALDQGEDWIARLPDEVSGQGPEARKSRKRVETVPWADFERELAFEGERSLRIRAQPPGKTHPSAGPEQREGDWNVYLRELRAPRARFRRPLAAGVALRLALHPDSLSADARPVISLELSEHAAETDGRPSGTPADFVVWQLEYYLVDEARAVEPPGWVGASYRIPVAARAGEWNELRLEVSRDAVAAFGARGLDNALARIRMGVETRGEAEATVHFDALRIEQELSGQPAIERQVALVEEMARRYPSLREFSGLEISYLEPHLNVYGVAPAIPDYEALLVESGLAEGAGPVDAERFGRFVAERVVADAHARGGLVSFNHMFGTGMERERQDLLVGPQERTREELLEELLGHRLFGADLLEVGYRDRGGHDLDEHVWVWDQLSLAGLFPVATGVSDSHGGPEQRWAGGGNNFVSWILAPSPTRADLLAGLAAGRVFFGDIEHFDGSLDLVTERGFRMGQVVVTDREALRVRALLEGLAPGQTWHWVGGADDGPSGAGADQPLLELPFASREQALARLEIRERGGQRVVCSNAIHFVRSVPPGGLPAQRAGVDLGGVRATALAGLTLLGARRTAEGVELEIEAALGAVELLLDSPEPAREVSLEPAPGQRLEGSWRAEGRRVLISELSGRGRIRLGL